MRAERILSMGGFEIFFYLREDWNQFFQVLLFISLRLLEIGEILARTLSCVTNKCKLIHRRLTFVRPKRQFRK